MKVKLFLLILLISFMSFSCKEKVINVQKEEPAKEATNKKENDVEIFQSKNLYSDDTLNFSYELVIYSNEHGALTKSSPFIWSTHDNYDKAKYEWTNDSTLMLKLFSTSGIQKSNLKYTVHSNGSKILEVL